MDPERAVVMEGYRQHAPPLSPIYDGPSLTGHDVLHTNAKSGRIPLSADPMPRRTAPSSLPLSKLADFFSAEVFQSVLRNPAIAYQMLKFSRAHFCGENLEFLEKVNRCHELLKELTEALSDMHHSFTVPDAPSQLNLTQTVMEKFDSGIRTSITSTLPGMEAIFSEPQERIESLVYMDIYPRFVRHQVAMSAARALARDRGRYQGLGDCFCLTDPAKADNPIVCASDGFVDVTGYRRNEIIPRNCRFLQGRLTEQSSVQRLKAAIKAREESVELLLNYNSSGEPFWNLLYVAPLFNADGDVAFFLGAQINCSTTIHSFADVLRVLSQPDDVGEDRDKVQTIRGASASRKGFFTTLRHSGSNKDPANREVGMEQALLHQIEGMSLKTQMDTFYTAYSKYLVMSYDNLAIRFCSAGIVKMVNPDHPIQKIVGTNVFKFLNQHATSISRDYRSSVRASLKVGQAISLHIRLSTHHSDVSRSEEEFVTHWTPLKDEHAVVTFVVLTMGSLVSS